MPKLKWTRAYELRIPEVDDEHRDIFRLAADLGTETAPERMNEIVDRIAHHAATHFSHEERLMRDARCPSYDWHKRQHDTARARLRSLEPRIREGDRAAASDLVAFLSEWLDNHIRITDRMMGASVQRYARELGGRR